MLKTWAMVLDDGKAGFDKANWVVTEGGSFQLFVDGEYIAHVQLDDDKLIVVSTMHKVELRGDA